jgi:hypothetical protein
MANSGSGARDNVWGFREEERLVYGSTWVLEPQPESVRGETSCRTEIEVWPEKWMPVAGGWGVHAQPD